MHAGDEASQSRNPRFWTWPKVLVLLLPIWGPFLYAPLYLVADCSSTPCKYQAIDTLAGVLPFIIPAIGGIPILKAPQISIVWKAIAFPAYCYIAFGVTVVAGFLALAFT
jgi:hypothetical protein